MPVLTDWMQAGRWRRPRRGPGLRLVAAAAVGLAVLLPAGAATAAASPAVPSHGPAVAAAPGSASAVNVAAGQAAPMAAVSSAAASDRAPAEIALLGVCCALLVGVAALVVRRMRVRGWRPRRAPQQVRPSDGEAETVPLPSAAIREPEAELQPGTPVRGAEADPQQGTAARGTATDPRQETDGRGAADPQQEPDGRGAADPQQEPAVPGADRGLGGPRSVPRARALLSAVAAIALAGGTAAAVLLVHDSGPASRHSLAAAVSGGPGYAQFPGQGGTSAGSPAPGKRSGHDPAGAAGQRRGQSSGGADGRSGSHSGSSGSSSDSSASAPATPTQGTNAPPAAGTLSVAPTEAPMSGAAGSVTFTGHFTITAAGGAVSYTVSEPAAEQSSWTTSIENASGTLQAGEQVTVTVTITDIDGTSDPYVTVDPGGMTVTFYVPVKPSPCPTKIPCP
jgi:hypothetical protein